MCLYTDFDFAHLVNFTLTMKTNNWTSEHILYTNEGQELFLKLLNDTKIAIYQFVFKNPNSSKVIDDIALFNAYSIKPGHCMIYDGTSDVSPNVTIYFDCELNSDNFTVITSINSALLNPSILESIDSRINGLIQALFTDDIIGPLSKVGLRGLKAIEFIYDHIYIAGAPTMSPVVITTKSPAQADGDNATAPSLQPTTSTTDTPDISTDTPSMAPTIEDMTTTTSPTIIDGDGKEGGDNGGSSNDNLVLYISVGIGSAVATMCIVGILWWVRQRQIKNSHSVKWMCIMF